MLTRLPSPLPLLAFGLDTMHTLDRR